MNIQTKINQFIDVYNFSINEFSETIDENKFEETINDTSISVKQKYTKSTMKSVTDMEKYYKEIISWLCSLNDKDILYYVPKVEYLLQVKNVIKD